MQCGFISKIKCNEVNLKIPNILGVLNPLTKVNLEKTRQKAKSNVYDIIRMNAL